MQRLIVVLALVLASAQGCRRPPSTIPSFTERHPNGLVVTLPSLLEGSGYQRPRPVTLERTPSGFQVFVARKTISRHATTALVEIHTDAAAPPGEWPKKRSVRGQVVHYAIGEADAGMGGTEYTLRAWLRCRGGYVMWSQSELDELATPPFDLAWTLVEGTEPPR